MALWVRSSGVTAAKVSGASCFEDARVTFCEGEMVKDGRRAASAEEAGSITFAVVSVISIAVLADGSTGSAASGTARDKPTVC